MTYPKSYSCDITISSNDGHGTFTVTVNVVPRVCEGTHAAYLRKDQQEKAIMISLSTKLQRLYESIAH
jgi:hypothetical protein